MEFKEELKVEPKEELKEEPVEEFIVLELKPTHLLPSEVMCCHRVVFFYPFKYVEVYKFLLQGVNHTLCIYPVFPNHCCGGLGAVRGWELCFTSALDAGMGERCPRIKQAILQFKLGYYLETPDQPLQILFCHYLRFPDFELLLPI